MTNKDKKKEEKPLTLCPVDRSLSQVGDRWTLLILRELGMGVRKFEDIQAITEMSSNLLNLRLKRLEEIGIIERRAYSSRPPRYEYFATTKGKELDAVLLAFRAWGMKWGEYAPGTEPGVKAVYRETGEVVDAAWQIPPDAYPFTFDALDASLTEGYLKERNEKLVAHKARKQQARKTRA